MNGFSAKMSVQIQLTCRKCSLTLLFLLFLQSAFSQNTFRRTTSWLENNVQILGGHAILLIVRDSTLIYQRAINEMNKKQAFVRKIAARRQGSDPLKVTQDYNINSRESVASASKWQTAAVVMTFIDDGTLKLEDPISRFLPVFAGTDKANITVVQCLSHLTGIRGGNLRESREMILAGKSMDEVMKSIAGLPMEGKPESVFHYGSIGLQIAAAVIEKISGEDFRTVFEKRIAIPCEMNQTDFGKSIVPLVAGGMITTPHDYMNFLQMILQKGYFKGKEVLSRSSIEQMQKNYIGGTYIAYSPTEAGDWGYGLGEWVMAPQDNFPAVASPGLFGCFPWVDIERTYAGLLFVFNFQNKGRGELYRELKNIVDSEIRTYELY